MLRGAAEAWPCSLLMLMLMLLLASWGPRWVGRGPRWVEVRTAGAKCARQGAAVGRSRSSCSRAQQQGAAAATLFSNCCIHSVSGGRSCDWEVSATAVPPSPPAPGSGQYPVSRCLQPASMVAPVGRMEFVMVVARLCVCRVCTAIGQRSLWDRWGAAATRLQKCYCHKKGCGAPSMSARGRWRVDASLKS